MSFDKLPSLRLLLSGTIVIGLLVIALLSLNLLELHRQAALKQAQDRAAMQAITNEFNGNPLPGSDP